MTGIYKISSLQYPDRFYIGSAVSYKARIRIHLTRLINNNHHSPKLQNHVNKYGIDDISFSLVEECSKELLLIKEQEYLNNRPFFNICMVAGSSSGIKRTDEHRRKTSIASSRRREQLRNQRLGTKATDETKKKQSDAKKGKPNLSSRIPILCISTNTKYLSITEAAQDLGLSAINIIRVCKGVYKTSGGKTFKYQ